MYWNLQVCLFLPNLFVKDVFRHICPHCGLKYRTERVLQLHMSRTHPSEAGGKCPICPNPADFPTRKLLSQHIEVEHIKPTITIEYYEPNGWLKSVSVKLVVKQKYKHWNTVKPELITTTSKWLPSI